MIVLMLNPDWRRKLNVSSKPYLGVGHQAARCSRPEVADCTPVALPAYHRDWVQGRVVLMACPKLDDLAAHTAKLVQILQTAKPRLITILRMEVPCCGGLDWAAKQANELANTAVPINVVTVKIDGSLSR